MEQDKIIIGKKGVDIEPGIIFAPYIPMTSIHGYGPKNTRRKKKINKLYKLELNIDDDFQPSNSMMTRYSKKMINKKFYTTIEVK